MRIQENDHMHSTRVEALTSSTSSDALTMDGPSRDSSSAIDSSEQMVASRSSSSSDQMNDSAMTRQELDMLMDSSILGGVIEILVVLDII